jgi:hypothetical protein
VGGGESGGDEEAMTLMLATLFHHPDAFDNIPELFLASWVVGNVVTIWSGANFFIRRRNPSYQPPPLFWYLVATTLGFFLVGVAGLFIQRFSETGPLTM